MNIHKEIKKEFDGKVYTATIKKMGYELKNNITDMATEVVMDSTGEPTATIRPGKLKTLMVKHGVVKDKCDFPVDVKTLDPEIGDWLAEEIGAYNSKKKPTSETPSKTEAKTQK